MTSTTSTHETGAESTTNSITDETAPDATGAGDVAAGADGEVIEGADGLPLDLVFESLKNSRRRQVLRYLRRAEESASVGELAEHVAAIENDTTVQQLSSQQRKRVYVGLYQCHLPKLDDKDIVEYDDDRGTVELGPNADQLETYLAVAEGGHTGGDRPWPHYYLGLAGAGAVFLALAFLVLGGGALGTAAAATGVALAVGLASLSAVHAREVE